MRKLLLRFLSDDTDSARLDNLEMRVADLETLVQAEHNPPTKESKPESRKRIVTKTMSDYRQAMGEEEIHVP